MCQTAITVQCNYPFTYLRSSYASFRASTLMAVSITAAWHHLGPTRNIACVSTVWNFGDFCQLWIEKCTVRYYITAYISPIYKKGDSSEACNYWPISLTCTLCKIMEVTVKDHVMKYLLSKGLISNKRHAFIAKHSTVTNLIARIYAWLGYFITQ